MIDSTIRTGLTKDQIEGESFAVVAKKSIYHDEDDSDVSLRRKAYPQRPNRTKLNYRDLERGMFEQIRQTEWNNTITPSSSSVKQNSSKDHLTKSSPISETRCAMRTCKNLVKLGSAYCSKRCIRQQVDERLKRFTNGKLLDDEIFLLRDVQTKKSLEKKFSSNTDDLYRWLIEHRSHMIIKSSSTNDKTTEIRSKVPKALYEKLLLRSEKSGEFLVTKVEIERIVNEIEEEMFRLYKKIDNSYKNKFRSLLANISNTNNNFFFREILSGRWTAEKIVSMKAEDMLPPEEKEKRKDEFHREVQMIIQGEIPMPLTKPIEIESHRSESEEHERTTIVEQSTMTTTSTSVTGQVVLPSIDTENDYIEPESPTGVDALIYDDADENEENSSSTTTSPSQSPIVSSNREDYNPSKMINATCPMSVTPQWRGIITISSELSLHCQSTKIFGENEYLLEHLPKQMNVLGRLRVIDLWHYVRDSISVRDILIFTVTSSSLSNMKDDSMFSEYFHSMRHAHRAAVMTKQFDSSIIRDLYILPAETLDCPSFVSSTFALPKFFESNQFFLIVIGSTKRSNENETTNSFVYKPIVLQDVTIPRDPRLSKNRDDLQTFIDETWVKIRQASSIEAMEPIISSLLQILKDRQREDLELKFTEDLRKVLSEWQMKTQSSVAGDNLIEENMEVDEEVGEEKSDAAKMVVTDPPRRERKRKSRFSDIIPKPQDRSTFRQFTSDFRNVNGQISTNSSINRIRPSRFSSTKESSQPLKSNPFQYERSPKLFDEFTEQIKSHSFANFSFEKNQWMNATLPRIPLRSEATVKLFIEQRKLQSRVSSTKSNYTNSSTDYYDFDRPEE